MTDLKNISDLELFGDAWSGRCMDCKWYWNSAITKSCGCGPNGDEELRRKLISIARERRKGKSSSR